MKVFLHRVCPTGLVMLLANAAAVAAQYAPPIGIPAPPFGVAETHMQYSGKTYAAGGFVYRDAGSGPYTHYVDNRSGCTSTTYGTATEPRCTIPTSVPAGSVVEIHGGPYSGADWTGNGTAAAPVFYRGANANAKALFNGGEVSLGGAFTIAEHLDLAATRFSMSGSSLSLRHSHVHDHPGVGSLVTPGGIVNVVYNNEINGNRGTDRHGVGATGGARDVWILDNHIYGNSGDGIQFCHSCIGTGRGPQNVYIGRNRIHDDHENAIDIKETLGPVIISQNEMYGYVATGTSNGEAVRINDEGAQGEIWLIGNRIHSSQHGIQPNNNHSTGVFIVGNLIHNLTGNAIRGDGGYVSNNTIYSVNTGIESGTEVRNNVIMNAATHIASGVGSCSHNLVYQSGSAVSASGSCSNTLNANPLFLNAAGNNFGLQSASPARNSGTTASPFARFQSTYGRSIALDYTGAVRPQEGMWDRGATEFGGAGGGTTPPPQPSAPTNVRIIR